MSRHAAYQERLRVQTLRWAMGKPVHNPVDNECCPDFSCCVPDLFIEDSQERWGVYRNYYPELDRSAHDR